MAASRSRSSRSRSSRSSRTTRSSRTPRRLKKASPALAASGAPWVRNGVDHGPFRAAIHDLTAWALDLAERAVDDWPRGQTHVSNTRRFLFAKIAGTRPTLISADDLAFTAGLLARILDEDYGLALTDALSVLDRLDLPTDVVPMPPRTPPTPTGPMARSASQASSFTPPPLRYCDDCGAIHEVGDHLPRRNAA